MIYALAALIVIAYIGWGGFKIYYAYSKSKIEKKNDDVYQSEFIDQKMMMESLLSSRSENVFFDKIVVGHDNLCLKGYAKTKEDFLKWKDKINSRLSLKEEKTWNYLNYTSFEVLLEKTF